MFLQDHDFESTTTVDVLKVKLNEIQAFTTALFSDIQTEELNRYQSIQERFEQLKISLFSNSDRILSQTKGQGKHAEEKALREAQLHLMFDWEQFGLTEDMFLKIYQCHRNRGDSNPEIQKRINILQQILAIETNLILLFKIRQTKI